VTIIMLSIAPCRCTYYCRYLHSTMHAMQKMYTIFRPTLLCFQKDFA